MYILKVQSKDWYGFGDIFFSKSVRVHNTSIIILITHTQS